MKKTLSFIITLCIILASLVIIPVSAADVEYEPDMSWYNTTDTEFTISTPWALLGVAEVMSESGETFEGKTIKLANNIILNTGNAADWKTTDPTNVWTPIGNSAAKFKGTFDGQGHAVSGIFVYGYNNGVGMFGTVDGATIINLAITNSYIYSAGNDVGGVVGYVSGTGTQISGVYADIIIETVLETTGINVGGIVGKVESGLTTAISNCAVAGSISGRAYVAGIVGETYGTAQATSNLTIENCANFASITGVAHSVSGIVGRAEGTTISKCLNAGNVLSTSGSYASGLIGRVQGGKNAPISITNSYSCTDVIPATQATAPVNNYYGVIKDETPTTVEGCAETTTAAIKGEAAKTVLTALDFDNTWTTVENGLPTLKTVAALIEASAVVPTYPEYNPSTGDTNNDGENNDGQQGENTEGNTTTETSENTGNTNDNKTTDTTAANEEEKGGCGSSVAVGSIAILGISAAGIALVGKKKKDQE